jgi:hypothetical protein
MLWIDRITSTTANQSPALCKPISRKPFDLVIRRHCRGAPVVQGVAAEVWRSAMSRRGWCRCGYWLTALRGPRGYKTRCPNCNSFVRLRRPKLNSVAAVKAPQGSRRLQPAAAAQAEACDYGQHQSEAHRILDLFEESRPGRSLPSHLPVQSAASDGPASIELAGVRSVMAAAAARLRAAFRWLPGLQVRNQVS